MKNIITKIKSVVFLSAVAALCFHHVQAGTVFPIATNSGVEFAVGGAFDGTNFLVAIQGDLVTNVPTRRFNLEAQRFSQTGVLLGSKVSLGLTDSEPFAAFDGNNYLVVSELMDTGGTDGIYGRFVNTSGNPVGGAFMISHGVGTRNPDAVIFGKTDYLVIWTDSRREAAGPEAPGDHDIYAQRVSTAGQLLGGEIKISGAAGKNSATAFDGTNYLVIWNEDVNDTDMYGRLVNSSGAFATAEFVIDGNSLPSDGPYNSVVFDGTNYFVIFKDENEGWDIFGKFVTATGGVLTNRILIADGPGDQIIPSLAFDGSNYLVSWSDFGTTNLNIHFKFFNRAGQPMSSAFTVFSPQGTNAPLFGAVGFFGKQFVAGGHIGAFATNGQFSSLDVFGAFIAPLPHGTFPIAITNGSAWAMSAAFDGTNFLAAIEGDQISRTSMTAQLFSPDGTLLGSRISLGRTGGLPVVGFDGTNYLMAWEDTTGQDGSSSDILGQFISPSGALVRSLFAISSQGGRQSSPNPPVFDGGHYLTVWSDGRNGNTNIDIYGQLVTPDGTLFGAEIPVATEAAGQQVSSLAFDGTNFFVIWQSRRNSEPEWWDTYGKFISKTGVPGTRFLISQLPSARYNPTSLAFDGTNYMAVWSRDIGPGFPNPSDWDIYARLVTRSGAFVGNEFAITTAPGSQSFGWVGYDGSAYLVNWFDATANTTSRFFSRSGVPLTAEFSLFGPQGTRSQLTSFLFTGSHSLALATYIELASFSQFTNGNVYGLILPSPRLSFTASVANGQVPLQFTGMPGVGYTIQASTNLLSTNTAWTTLLTTNSLNGTLHFTETNAASFGRRFYRAVQQ